MIQSCVKTKIRWLILRGESQGLDTTNLRRYRTFPKAIRIDRCGLSVPMLGHEVPMKIDDDLALGVGGFTHEFSGKGPLVSISAPVESIALVP